MSREKAGKEGERQKAQRGMQIVKVVVEEQGMHSIQREQARTAARPESEEQQ